MSNINECKNGFYCIEPCVELQQLKAELQAYKDKVKPINFVDSDEYLKVVEENKQLKAENELLKNERTIDLRNQLDKLKAERDLLLNQLVVLDGEDVTVQVTQDQFEEYNKLKAENEGLQSLNDFNVQKIETLEAENEELKDSLGLANKYVNKYKTVLDEIEEIAIKRKNSNDVIDWIEILQLIKQAKEE